MDARVFTLEVMGSWASGKLLSVSPYIGQRPQSLPGAKTTV